MLGRTLLFASLTLAVAGCEEGPTVLRPDSGTVIPMGDVTYYGDVRPLLVENCVVCHTRGGIAPFDLESFPAAVEVSDRMAEVTRDRIMPPFLADNSGDCQTFSNFRGLTQEEIDTFQAWIDGGRLEGDPTTPEPTPPVLDELPIADLTVEMASSYTVDSSLDDDYRCFVVDPGTTADTYVTGYDVMPGNPQRVHHVIMYNPASDAEAAEAVALDDEDGVIGNGYQCFGGPRVDAPPLVLWAPGAGATRFPRGTGIPLAAGRLQVVQIHYNNLVASAPEDDLTSIRLSTTATANMAFLFPLVDTSLVLPPRMAEVSTSRTMSLSFIPTNLRAWGVFPHMHTLGRTLRVELNTDECMIDIPRWDFDWQLAYWYDRPQAVSQEDSVTITCTYDTTERDETVRWGDGTQDEMCVAFVYLTL